MTAAADASLPWQRSAAAMLQAVADGLRDAEEPVTWRRIGGSGATSHWSMSACESRFFVKTVEAGDRHVLDAEREGLQAIGATHAVRVPRVMAFGEDAGIAFVVLEWLDIVATGGDAALGEALARMHESTSTRFGWHADNMIGASPQRNAWSSDWATFFRDQRLRFQVDLAARNGLRDIAREGQALLERVPELLHGHAPKPSLVHGDLWSGNAARLADGSPVMFDPAAYYGDRETDLAMAALFGGFDASFHAAYAALSPLPPGYERRRLLYNLYHVLNHANLFGGGYVAQARRMIADLLRH